MKGAQRSHQSSERRTIWATQEADALFRTQWHFQKDLVNAPVLFLSSSFYSSISVILEFIRKSLMQKKVNIVLLFYSTYPKIISKIRNLFFKKVKKNRNMEYRKFRNTLHLNSHSSGMKKVLTRFLLNEWILISCEISWALHTAFKK